MTVTGDAHLDAPLDLVALDAPDQPVLTSELDELYSDFERELLVPLWTEISDLMLPIHARTPLLELDRLGHAGAVEPGHAAVRFTNPTDGRDVLPTIRAEVHRIAQGVETVPVRETGSSVYGVFDGSGTVSVGATSWSVTRGDLFVVPSWQPFSARSEAGPSDSDSGALDLFRLSDAPILEALRLDRIERNAR